MPKMIWKMVGRKDELYRPRCRKDCELLCKKMVPCFLPEAAENKSQPFWVSMCEEMNRVVGHSEETILPFFKQYLISTEFLVDLQMIFYEVAAQPH
jgi:hypothetical protein